MVDRIQDKTRLAFLEDQNITVLRAHSTVDATHVGPALWDALGLAPPVFSGWVYSHHTVEPITVAQLAALPDSPEKELLLSLTHFVIHRAR